MSLGSHTYSSTHTPLAEITQALADVIQRESKLRIQSFLTDFALATGSASFRIGVAAMHRGKIAFLTHLLE